MPEVPGRPTRPPGGGGARPPGKSPPPAGAPRPEGEPHRLTAAEIAARRAAAARADAAKRPSQPKGPEPALQRPAIPLDFSEPEPSKWKKVWTLGYAARLWNDRSRGHLTILEMMHQQATRAGAPLTLSEFARWARAFGFTQDVNPFFDVLLAWGGRLRETKRKWSHTDQTTEQERRNDLVIFMENKGIEWPNKSRIGGPRSKPPGPKKAGQ